MFYRLPMYEERTHQNFALKRICYFSKLSLVGVDKLTTLCIVILTRRIILAHPHTKLSLPVTEALSTKPILHTQIPALDAMSNKLLSFIDASVPASETQAVKYILTSSVVPYLKDSTAKDSDSSHSNKNRKQATPQLLASWAGATRILANHMPSAQLFPVVDMWRIALLDNTVAEWCANIGCGGANGSVSDPVEVVLSKGIQTLDSPDPAAKTAGRSYLLMSLKMLANGFSNQALAGTLVSQLAGTGKGKRNETTKVLVAGLLHEEPGVRTAAASLAFNIAAFLQKARVDQVRGSRAFATHSGTEEDGDWEMELVSAVLEALSNETQSEEVGTLSSLADGVVHSPAHSTHHHIFRSYSASIDSSIGILASPFSSV